MAGTDETLQGGYFLTGDAFRRFVEAGTLCVRTHVDTINALNVFPVPDGDTGTNLLLTLQDATNATELPERGSGTVADVSTAIARGALLGARGNSGVIFSQFLKGLASGLGQSVECDGPAIWRALAIAADGAYGAVGVPVEGTMLTVMRAAAQAAPSSSDAKGRDVLLRDVWESAYKAAYAALLRTPDQLPVLKEAGVVDAGGHGVVSFMAGGLAFLDGRDAASVKIATPGITPAATAPAAVSREFIEHTKDEFYGYCTQFVVRGTGIDVEKLRSLVGAIAVSTVVVGDETIARVHAHAADPGPLLSLGSSRGALEQIKIENMDAMHQEFMALHGHGEGPVPVAVVAVSPSEGLERVFRELGAAVVVSGGQTMNPSAKELLDGVARAGAQHVVVLPNNPNILMAAQQAQELSECPCTVVLARTVPQGVAALLAFNPDLSAEANAQAMTEALAGVRSGEVTTAVRDSVVDGVKVRRGQTIALLDGGLAAAADTPSQALVKLLRHAGVSSDALVTLYWGADVDEASASEAMDEVRREWPGAEVEAVAGGQPHYHYLVSIE